MTDIVVCGLGPSGRALAHRCLARGLRVAVVDPAPHRRWTATYAIWGDELPGWLDPAVVAARVARPVAWGTVRHELDREYLVLDTGRLQDSLTLDGAEVIAERAVRVSGRSLTTASGRVLRADRVIDARGVGRSPRRAEQTAYGVVVAGSHAADGARAGHPGAAGGAAAASPRHGDDATLFMDWRAGNGAGPGEPRSFLYVVPLGGGATLYEETCLAGRPAIGLGELRRRLEHRLAARGITLAGDETVERVRFPVQGGRPGAHRFGAAGGFLHPATGYSVAASLGAADEFAEGAPARLGRARAAHALRVAGLRALLALPPAELPVFFDAFFSLPSTLQRAYLSGRTDPVGVAAAMRALFTAVPPGLRTRIAAATCGFPFSRRMPTGSSIME
ncbi:MAG TPA: lycopene cyclase family protein [Nocardia sp.]|uniref:lycopene cyclase family protein n=1 Tax=Nocardia sp. TaxID=1821 RepID=UPI002B4B8FFC|nr:lycopene cyclase family protein [Nocardia sp.]HLS75642.1 lycopene cyclase family protein [Nocardia sp.]